MTLDLAYQYFQIASMKDLSEMDAIRMARILDIAQIDEVLSGLIAEIDALIFQHLYSDNLNTNGLNSKVNKLINNFYRDVSVINLRFARICEFHRKEKIRQRSYSYIMKQQTIYQYLSA
ncbi:hypothetical protein LC593_34175 [Nostoc sp. CHAB 5844]|nr:hypothetical protein [Nostoc sp. CHAB 5844]